MFGYEIKEHRLLKDSLPVKFTGTENIGGVLVPKRRRFLVLHYTAGPSLAGAVNTFANPKRKVSAHLVIDTDGTVVQVVPFDRVAFHAGQSKYKPKKGVLPISGLNNFSIGIELVNAGPLTAVSSTKEHSKRTWWGAQVLDVDVVEVDPKAPSSFGKKFWHRFQEKQIAECLEICKTLCDTYGLEEILGHSDITDRKSDPGPAFPMDHIRSAIFGRI